MDNSINIVNMDLIDMDCVHVVPNSSKRGDRNAKRPPPEDGNENEQQKQQQPTTTNLSPKSTPAQRRRRRARAKKAAAQKQQKAEQQDSVSAPSNSSQQQQQQQQQQPEQPLPSPPETTTQIEHRSTPSPTGSENPLQSSSKLQQPTALQPEVAPTEHLINISDEQLISECVIATTNAEDIDERRQETQDSTTNDSCPPIKVVDLPLKIDNDTDTDIIDLITSNGFAGPITRIQEEEVEEEPKLTSAQPETTLESALAARPSRLQFNTLSDGEDSEIEELAQNRDLIAAKGKSQVENEEVPKNGTSTVNAKIDASTSPISSLITMFPKLDEGLSSEAELSSDEDPADLDEKQEDEAEGVADADDEDDEQVVVKIMVDPTKRVTKNGIVKGTTNFLLNGEGDNVLNNPITSNTNSVNVNSGGNSATTTTATTTTNPIKSILQQPPALRISEDQEPVVKKQVTISDNNQRLSSDTDNETDRLLGSQRSGLVDKQPSDQMAFNNHNGSNGVNGLNPPASELLSQQQQQSPPSMSMPTSSNSSKPNSNFREVLIEGVLFNVKYLGSTHTDCEGRGEKEDRIHQAEMAVHEVKMRNDSGQAIEVQLFISTEKIMVLDDRHRKLLMDHSLRTVSYIADIGDAIVLIVRTKTSQNNGTGPSSASGEPPGGRLLNNPRISCHVFESVEAHTITKSISQAFQVAYTKLLKANGITDPLAAGSSYPPKELDYQQVLNSQEMSTEELEMFARRENQREVIVPKALNEKIGLSIVESGWGSVLPTVVIANIKQDGPADKCKKLSVGDQILSVNGVSLVGLPLSDCQEILRRTKTQTVARLSVVPCPITVEVKIKRPDTKYQLGFSVQNGVICSLLRGGIAERGGVRVGHRIMSINGTTVVGAPHDKIVTMLASSVGEIRMKTCLTSLYKLILGEEKPVFF